MPDVYVLSLLLFILTGNHKYWWIKRDTNVFELSSNVLFVCEKGTLRINLPCHWECAILCLCCEKVFISWLLLCVLIFQIETTSTYTLQIAQNNKSFLKWRHWLLHKIRMMIIIISCGNPFYYSTSPGMYPFFFSLIASECTYWLMIAYIALFSALLSRLTALACGSTWVTTFYSVFCLFVNIHRSGVHTYQ